MTHKTPDGKDYIKCWLTSEEIIFARNMYKKGLANNYKKAIKQRVDFGRIDKDRLFLALGIEEE